MNNNLSIIKYMGGKRSMIKHILPFPVHTTYVEVFGGGGALLLNKKPAKFEFYNDINSLLVNFYQVIKNDYESLIAELEYEIASRSLFNEYRDKLKDNTLSKLEKAKLFYYLNQHCFGARVSSFCHRGIAFERNDTNSYFSNMLKFKTVHERISHVNFLNLDYNKLFKKLLKITDKPSVLIYVDPPYSTATKYGFGFTNEKDLVNVVKYCESFKHAQIIFSYDQNILPHWRHELFTKCVNMNDTKVGKQNEYVFYNKNCKPTKMSDRRQNKLKLI